MKQHWADERPSFELRLPTGTCVLIEPDPDREAFAIWFKPLTQPSARIALARELEKLAEQLWIES